MEHYIRIEEKDRLHSLNHFTHVKRSDPDEARHIQPTVEEHMQVIDQRIAQALDMLKHFPKVQEQLNSSLGKTSPPPRALDMLKHFPKVQEQLNSSLGKTTVPPPRALDMLKHFPKVQEQLNSSLGKTTVPPPPTGTRHAQTLP